MLRRLTFMAVAMALFAAACGPGTETVDDRGTTAVTETADDRATSAATRAFDHSQGTTQIPTRPERIVTTTDQNALLPLLELSVVPVGSAGFVGEDGTKKFRRTEGFDTSGVTFTGSYLEPNAEAVAALRPDLIVGHEVYDEYYDTLSKIAPTVLINIFERPLDQALMDFAALVNRAERGEELRDAYRARIQQLLARLGDRRDPLTVSVITSGEPGQFLRADDQAIGTVVAALNLNRPAPQQGKLTYDPYSIERLPEHDADVVLAIDFRGDQDPSFTPGFDALIASPLYRQLAASRAGQAYIIDGTKTVGAAWARMNAFLDDLERILLNPALRTDVVS